jgi:DinB superfamily
MNTDCIRIADQLRRAFDGKAWHGPAVNELLSGTSAEQACAHPVAGAHSIFELVLHVEEGIELARGAVNGAALPSPTPFEVDWPPVKDSGSAAWIQSVTRMLAAKNGLGQLIERFGDAHLSETVPGRQYDFYFLFHGVIQHSLYHGGQIALLKKIDQISLAEHRLGRFNLTASLQVSCSKVQEISPPAFTFNRQFYGRWVQNTVSHIVLRVLTTFFVIHQLGLSVRQL